MIKNIFLKMGLEKVPHLPLNFCPIATQSIHLFYDLSLTSIKCSNKTVIHMPVLSNRIQYDLDIYLAFPSDPAIKKYSKMLVCNLAVEYWLWPTCTSFWRAKLSFNEVKRNVAVDTVFLIIWNILSVRSPFYQTLKLKLYDSFIIRWAVNAVWIFTN